MRPKTKFFLTSLLWSIYYKIFDRPNAILSPFYFPFVVWILAVLAFSFTLILWFKWLQKMFTYLFTYVLCSLFTSLDSIFSSIYFFLKGILCRLALDFCVFLELEIEPRELCFDIRDPFIESVLLLRCLLEYRLFWELILT